MANIRGHGYGHRSYIYIYTCSIFSAAQSYGLVRIYIAICSSLKLNLMVRQICRPEVVRSRRPPMPPQHDVPMPPRLGEVSGARLLLLTSFDRALAHLPPPPLRRSQRMVFRIEGPGNPTPNLDHARERDRSFVRSFLPTRAIDRSFVCLFIPGHGSCNDSEQREQAAAKRKEARKRVRDLARERVACTAAARAPPTIACLGGDRRFTLIAARVCSHTPSEDPPPSKRSRSRHRNALILCPMAGDVPPPLRPPCLAGRRRPRPPSPLLPFELRRRQGRGHLSALTTLTTAPLSNLGVFGDNAQFCVVTCATIHGRPHCALAA